MMFPLSPQTLCTISESNNLFLSNLESTFNKFINSQLQNNQYYQNSYQNDEEGEELKDYDNIDIMDIEQYNEEYSEYSNYNEYEFNQEIDDRIEIMDKYLLEVKNNLDICMKNQSNLIADNKKRVNEIVDLKKEVNILKTKVNNYEKERSKNSKENAVNNLLIKSAERAGKRRKRYVCYESEN